MKQDNILTGTAQDVAQLLRKQGINPTQQRVEIAQIMLARPQHLSADQLLDVVNRERATVSKATVYNTLRLFVQHGLIHEVIVDPSKVFYDSNTGAHHHIYNADTGMLMDVDADRINLPALPPLPEGTVAEGVDVIIRVRNSH
ncbi:MAG: transcriptional repressor [Gammaproteobacteria bacterium]|nr:MAG: transcriptional repressor [Gammaproteobacteria bacterium]